MVTSLTESELEDFWRLTGIIVSVSSEFAVPGADDARIFADIVASLDPDEGRVREALAALREACGGSFADLDDGRAEAEALALMDRGGPEIRALEQGAFELLDAVRGRPRMWRDVDGFGS